MDLYTICLWTGIAIFAVKLFELYKRLAPYFTAPVDVNERYIKGKKDVWAVVTGASEGAGRDWAIELSKRGFNIILIARTVSKLEKVAQELNPAVKSKILPKDFSKCDDEQFALELKKDLQDFNIAALVNNVGVIDVERFEKISAQTIANHIKVKIFRLAIKSLNTISDIFSGNLLKISQYFQKLFALLLQRKIHYETNQQGCLFALFNYNPLIK